MRRPAALGFAVLLAAGACDDSATLTSQRPELSLEDRSLDFGAVPIGATKRVAIQVVNSGRQLLRIEELRVAAPFSARLETSEIPPSGSARIDVDFSPVAADVASGALELTSNAESGPVLVSLRGEGVQAVLRGSPAELDFGSVRLQESAQREIVLTTNTIAPVEGRIVTDSFVREAHWDMTFVSRFGEPATFALAGLDQQVLAVEYRPFTMGPDPGQILFEFCGDGCGVWVDVSADAVESRMRIDPPVLEFGPVGIQDAATEQVVVSNVGQTPFSVAGARIEGSEEVTVQPGRPLPVELQPGDNVALRVTYAPFAARELEATMVVTTDEADVGSRDVAIFGSGAGPRFEVVPELLQFGVVDERPTRRALLMVNSGSSSLEVQTVALAGDAQFTLVDPPPTPLRLGPGDTSILTVELEANRTGTFTATVSVATDDPSVAEVHVPARAFRGDRLCRLEAIPDSLNFGVLSPGLERQAELRFRNIGNEACQIRSVGLREPVDDFFGVAPDPRPDVLAPGDELVVRVFFSPTAEREAKASLVVETNDPLAPRQIVNLLGSGLFYVNVFVEPQAIDFGAIRPDCNRASQNLRLINAGSSDVEVVRVDPTPSVPELSRSGPIPVRVEDGESASWTVAWQPSEAGALETDVIVGFEDLPYPIRVPVQGRASLDARATDEFQQRDIEAVDVLFVIDNSCSMQDDQQALAANADTFIREADLQGVRYRIGVTTTSDWPDQGRLVGSVVDRDTMTRDEIIDEFRVQAQVGTGGSGIEEGVASAVAALRKAERGSTPNDQLLRPDASLAVIIVTDEDDSSPGNMTSYYRDLLRFAPNDLVVAVVSGGPGGCGTALPTPRYAYFLDLTDGTHISICDDWGSNLEELGRAAFAPRDRFELRQVPEPTLPVEVRVDDQLVPASAWSREPGSNVIVFATPPPPNAKVEVSYVPRCE